MDLPFSQFVLKIHERCNLACDYCYIYEMADDSWRDRPSRMDRRTLEAVVSRIDEHVRLHSMEHVDVILHGGEPLLAGRQFCADAADLLRSGLPNVRVGVSLQTNGVLLDERALDVFAAHHISVGVSLDGDASANDRHRRFRSGRGSYEKVATGLRLLGAPRYRHLFNGLLCTIDIDNDAVGTYEALLAFDPPTVDFLLPHGNWLDPPSGRPQDASTPYADWLISIFDRWFDAPERETRVRLFHEIIALLLGADSQLETIGLSPVGLVVVETDGSFEQVDTLKSAYDGAAATGLNIFGSTLQEVAQLSEIRRRRNGLDGLSAQCRSCSIVEVCGGGYYPHRYAADETFDHPSVYCADLYRLITHIAERVQARVRPLLTQVGEDVQ